MDVSWAFMDVQDKEDEPQAGHAVVWRVFGWGLQQKATDY